MWLTYWIVIPVKRVQIPSTRRNPPNFLNDIFGTRGMFVYKGEKMKKRIVAALLFGLVSASIIPATAQAETAVVPYQVLETTYNPPGSLGTPFWFYPW